MKKNKIFQVIFLITSTNFIFSQGLCEGPEFTMDYTTVLPIEYPLLSTREGAENELDFTTIFNNNENERDGIGRRPSSSITNFDNTNNGLPYFIPLCFDHPDQNQADYWHMSIARSQYPPNGGNQNNGAIYNQAVFEENYDTQAGQYPNRFILTESVMTLLSIWEDDLFDEVTFARNVFPNNNRRKLMKRSFSGITETGSFIYLETNTNSRKGKKVITDQIKDQFVNLRYSDVLNTYIAVFVTEYELGEPDEVLLWRADIGNINDRRNLIEEFHEGLDNDPNVQLDIANSIETIHNDDENIHGSLITSEDGKYYMKPNIKTRSLEIFSEDDFDDKIGFDFPSLFSVLPHNSLTFETKSSSTFEPYFHSTDHGRLLIRNSETKEIESVFGDDCITQDPFSNHKFVIEGGIMTKRSLTGIVWTKNPNEDQIKCVFPTKGHSSLKTNEKLIQYNEIPNNNELNYLFTADSNGNPDNDKISIKDGNLIKVIKRSDFNGNYKTSPTIQTFQLN